MRATTTLGLILAAAAALIIASQRVASETVPDDGDRRLVLRPTSMNAGAGLELASYGIAELTTDDGVAIPVLHVRAVISNTTRDLPWAVDGSKLRVELASGQIAPAFVNSDVATLPVAILDPRESRTIDFYFPLPSDLADHGGPVSFALTWPFNMPAHIVRTAWFERAAAITQARRQPDAAGWGQHWWVDPRYPWPAHRHRPGIATDRPPSYVIVTRAPRWEQMPPDADDPQLRENECDQW